MIAITSAATSIKKISFQGLWEKVATYTVLDEMVFGQALKATGGGETLD